MYSLLLLAAFTLAVFLMWRLYKSNLSFIRFNVTLDMFFDSVLLFFVSFGIGARILYVFEHWDRFAQSILLAFLFLHVPGFSFLGGVIGGILGLWFFCRYKKQPFVLLLDLIVIGVALVLGVSSIGNFVDAYRFDKLFEGVFALLFFGLLYWLYMRGKTKPGIISVYFLLYIGTLSFLLEIIRGHSVYWIGGGFVVLALLTLLFKNREEIRLFLRKKLGL